MSWAEVKKINGDLNTPLNVQMDNLAGDVADAIGTLGETESEAIGTLGTTLSGAIDTLGETGSEAIDALGEATSGAIGDQTEALENSIGGLSDQVTGAGTTVSSAVQGLRSYITGVGDVVGNAIRSIDNLKPSLRVTVLDAGTLTVTDGIHTYTEEVSEPGAVGFILQSLGDFTVTLAAGGQTFTQSVTVTELTVYRVTIGFPKLAVNAAEGGKITVWDGNYTYTQTLSRAGVANFKLEEFGTYAIKIETGQREGNESVNVTEFKTYNKDISYFQAVINVKCLLTSGVGTVTATSTDGLKTYSASCAAGNTTLTVTAARTYNIKVTQNGTDGEIVAVKEVTTSGETYAATAGFIAAIPDDYSGLEWVKLGPTSHTAVKDNLSTNYKNMISVTGRGLLLGIFNHNWLNYTTQNGTLQYQIVIDDVVYDQYIVPRSGYDHQAGWGNPISNALTVPHSFSTATRRTRNPSSMANIETTVITDIGKCVKFERNFSIRVRYQNTPDASDSIYYLEAAVYRY